MILRAAALAAMIALPLPVLAQNSDPAAVFEAAQRLHAGADGVPDPAGAVPLLEQSAAAGYAPAQNMLARMLQTGIGIDQDPARARALFEAAAAGGDPGHLLDLGRVVEPDDPARAAAIYQAAAQAGSAEAAVSLGVLFQSGTGVAQSFANAKTLYEMAAEAGHPRAMNNLGLLYVRGDGVAQDYARAAELFTVAVDAGLRPAMSNLATLYANGFGVEVDEARADALFRAAANTELAEIAPGPIYDARLAPPEDTPVAAEARARAANAGDPVALFQIGWLGLQATAGMEDPSEKLATEIRAARALGAAAVRGHGPAMANIGVLYHEGRGLAQDYVLGQMWLLRAQGAGVPEAAALVARFEAGLTVAQRNQAAELATQAGKSP